MHLILKPLFEAELPADFLEILTTKLNGRELREGETITVDILGKPLRFEVAYAEPRVLKVKKNTRIEISRSPISLIEMEFEREIEGLVPFSGGFVIVFKDEVLILNRKGHKIFNKQFEKLKEVKTSGNSVAVVHDDKKLTLIHVP
ncbi:ATPase [Thermococcus atlanticus]